MVKSGPSLVLTTMFPSLWIGNPKYATKPLKEGQRLALLNGDCVHPSFSFLFTSFSNSRFPLPTFDSNEVGEAIHKFTVIAGKAGE